MIESKIPEIFLNKLNKLADQYNVPLKEVKKYFLWKINRHPSFSFVSGWAALNWLTNLLNEYKRKNVTLVKKILTTLEQGQLLSSRQLVQQTNLSLYQVQGHLKILLLENKIKKTCSLHDARRILYYLNNNLEVNGAGKRPTAGQG